jgi:hypothetical protein
MGLQHGEMLRDEIRAMLWAISHHVLYGQPGIIGWGMRRAVRTVALTMTAHTPLRYRREIAGIARAADVSYRDLLLLNCFDDVLANLRLLGALFGRLGCSVFAITPERSDEQGELVCGRNLDYFVSSAVGDDTWAATQHLKEHLAVVEYQPEDRASFVSVGWPGFIGAATAMSEHGMVISSLTVATLRNLALATPATFVYRRIMEESTTLADAIAVVQRTRRSQGNNVLIGSAAEGDAVVVEYTPWRLAIRRPQDGWVAATNHFNHPDMVRYHANLIRMSSRERLARLGELCGDCAGTAEGAEILGQFLLDQECHNPDSNDYCTVLNPCTIYSTLFAPAQGRLWVRAADRPDRTFQEVALGV